MSSEDYIEIRRTKISSRLPLKGRIDLTYRCNNNCRHCWLRIPADAAERKDEISFAEIRKITEETKKMGCRGWSISGGEPILRLDFAEIFDYLTNSFAFYSINTNGSLITPKIAQLFKRKGLKMIALYGATAEVHDHITRNPGSFELTMRGFRYLKEKGAKFIVQLIPMKDNYHQFKDMMKLAQSLSKYYRISAAWLYLSACGAPEKNKEILQQRLPPEEVIVLDTPDLSYEEQMKHKKDSDCRSNNKNGYLFSSCIAARRDFHIDSYGQATFCYLLKDPRLRYDLRKGSFKECWEEFIPSLADKINMTEEYKSNCGPCALRNDCRYCGVYGYLEHRRFGAKVDYLCAVAKENKMWKDNWLREHRRYYRIADITIQVDSDLPISENTFHPKFKKFEINDHSENIISIRHHFWSPYLDNKNLGKEIYRKPPWVVYKKDDFWIYAVIPPEKTDKSLRNITVFNFDHTRARIYNDREEIFLKGGLPSLTLFPTDQILLARILADRQGCFFHSCGVNFEDKGMLFAGRSGTGKSTIAILLKDKADILCDDRIIVRSRPAGFTIYGTWSHGDVPDISAGSAPLRAILFLEKSNENRINYLKNKKDILNRLLSCLIKPFVTVDWWEKTLVLVNGIIQEVPCYELKFDKSGKMVDLLKKL